MSLDPALAWTVVVVLGAVFATAAITKLRALDAFEAVVLNYGILPGSLVRPVALALPVVELAAAFGLLSPATRPVAALVIAGLLVVFAGAMAVNLVRGRTDIDCGCFVTLLRQRIAWTLVVRNGLLACAALMLAVAGEAARPVAALDGVTVAAASLCLLLLYAATGRLFGLAPVDLRQAG